MLYDVYQGHHIISISNNQVKSCAVWPYKRYTLPAVKMEFSVLTEILCVWLRKFSLLKQLVLIILLPLHNFNHTTLVVVCKDMLYSRSLLCLYLYQVLSNALESTRLGTKADICDFFKAYLATDTFQFVPA